MKQVKTTLIAQFFVAGLVFGDADLNTLKLTRGQKLSLVREPDNPHDHDAIRIDYKDAKLGYVPRDQTGVLHDWIDQGEPLRCEVQQFAKNNASHRQVLVSVLALDAASKRKQKKLTVPSF